MADLNIVTLVGRLTKDPDLKYNAAQRPITYITVANNVGFGKNSSVNYIRGVAAGQVAEYLAKFGAKGRLVSISGELRVNSAKDENGVYQNKTTIFIRDLQFIGNGKPEHAEAENKKQVPEKPVTSLDNMQAAYDEAYSNISNEVAEESVGDDIPF
jgi:single-strand DNA-binding protein